MSRLFSLFIIFPLYLFGQATDVKSERFFDELNDEEYRVIVKKGTERAFSGAYVNFFEKGLYLCKACNNPLFSSESKFRSNCGWPSFDDEIPNSLIRLEDNSFGMKRIEICCANCKGHLGHVFEGEGLTEKDLRHCVNSISIIFSPKEY
tara:strand:- start:190 stop:636 length:447 start_codon:yes stop_codon:yes gene_type:complete